MSAVQLTRQKDDAVRPAVPSPADVEQIPLEQLPRRHATARGAGREPGEEG